MGLDAVSAVCSSATGIGSEPTRFWAEVVQSHEARDDQQLDLTVGERIIVIEKHESGWWGGLKPNISKKGWFPGVNVCQVPMDNSRLSSFVPSSPVQANSFRDSAQANGFRDSAQEIQALRRRLATLEDALVEVHAKCRKATEAQLLATEECAKWQSRAEEEAQHLKAAERTIIDIRKQLVSTSARNCAEELSRQNQRLATEVEELRASNAAADLAVRQAQAEKLTMLEELGEARGQREAALRELEDLRRQAEEEISLEHTARTVAEQRSALLATELAEALNQEQISGLRRTASERHILRPHSTLTESSSREERQKCPTLEGRPKGSTLHRSAAKGVPTPARNARIVRAWSPERPWGRSPPTRSPSPPKQAGGGASAGSGPASERGASKRSPAASKADNAQRRVNRSKSPSRLEQSSDGGDSPKPLRSVASVPQLRLPANPVEDYMQEPSEQKNRDILTAAERLAQRAQASPPQGSREIRGSPASSSRELRASPQQSHREVRGSPASSSREVKASPPSAHRELKVWTMPPRVALASELRAAPKAKTVMPGGTAVALPALPSPARSAYQSRANSARTSARTNPSDDDDDLILGMSPIMQAAMPLDLEDRISSLWS